MMTLDEAIQHCKDVILQCQDNQKKCAIDHIQLMQWLVELKTLRKVFDQDSSNGITNDLKNKLSNMLDNTLEETTSESWNKFLDEPHPKFKVGDWIVKNDGKDCFSDGSYVLQITDIDGLGYKLSNGCYLIEPFTDTYRLWIISDARDGDMLATKKGNPFIYDKNRYNNGLAYYYAGLDVNKELTLKSPHHMLDHFGELCSVFPATEGQRDFLFSKMKEAGWMWDAEKKELKKIEQKFDSYCRENCKGFQETGKCFADGECKANREGEQKPVDENKGNIGGISSAWSDADENEFNHILNILTSVEKEQEIKGYNNLIGTGNWLKSLKDRVQSQPKQGWNEEDEEMYNKTIKCIKQSYYSENIVIDWLKSLKFRHTWKPTDEQMEILQYLCETSSHPNEKVIHTLESLTNDLKKLREE